MANLIRAVAMVFFIISLSLMLSCMLLPWANITFFNKNVKSFEFSEIDNIAIKSFIPGITLLAVIITIALRMKGLSISTISVVHYFLGALVAVFCLFTLRLIDKKDADFFGSDILGSSVIIKPDWGIMLPLAGSVLLFITAFLEGATSSFRHTKKKKRKKED